VQIANGFAEHNPQSALKDALAYLDFGWWLLPCKWDGPNRKAPLTWHGVDDVSNDPTQVREWWSQWPRALMSQLAGLARQQPVLMIFEDVHWIRHDEQRPKSFNPVYGPAEHLQARIGVATGPSGLAVLDIDVKHPAKYGPDSLAELGHTIPETWIAHTPSGGWHHWFLRGRLEVWSSNNHLGPGLDTRGNTGYAMSPGCAMSAAPKTTTGREFGWHLSEASRATGRALNRPLLRAIREFGAAAFTVELLEVGATAAPRRN
jgi:hypothetical protein